MCDIDFHPMLGTDDISEDAMVVCHYHACLRSLSICVTIAIVLMILSFSCRYKGVDLFPVC
jgi:multisubunit Na+/H+ antiporter MnhF subunit